MPRVPRLGARDNTRRVVVEDADDLVDGVDEEGHDVAEEPRAGKLVVVVDEVALEHIEAFADGRAHEGRDEQVLVRRPLHKRLDAELPPHVADEGAVEQRLVEVEAHRAGAHEVDGAGVGVQDVVEDKLVVVPLAALIKDMPLPAFEQRHVLQLGAVPRRGVLGQTLEHQQGADEGTGEHAGIYPQAAPVVACAR